MTRINVVPPSELSRQHLLAEYRELPRVFTVARKRYDKYWPSPFDDIPKEYVLGKGHVLFFTQRLLFLLVRYSELVAEMQKRQYNPNPIALHDLVKGIPSDCFNNYTPTKEALRLNRQRIRKRS